MTIGIVDVAPFAATAPGLSAGNKGGEPKWTCAEPRLMTREPLPGVR